MVQRRGCPGFATKPFQRLRIVGNIFRQELQCDETSKGGVFRLVNHSHSTPAQQFNDSIMGDRLPNHGMVAGGLRADIPCSFSEECYGPLAQESIQMYLFVYQEASIVDHALQARPAVRRRYSKR